MRRRLLTAVAVTAGLFSTILTSQAAFAASGPTVGGDVSRHQETAGLPPLADFEIVAVNTGLPTGWNPFVLDQLNWASSAPGAGHSKVDVYVASANPAPKAASWWPSSNKTRAGVSVRSPYGSCSGGATRACSWVYGDSIARDDVASFASSVHIGRWWIDIEGGAEGNSWSSSKTRNRAVVEGMTTAFKSAKKDVGIYALTNQFDELIGTPPSSSVLNSLPSWVAGFTKQSSAFSRCSRAPLTAGRLQLVQWTEDGGLTDHDVACAVLTKAPKPTITGRYRVGKRLTAKAGTWGPGSVHLAYRWTRDGHDIAKATHRTYVLKKADERHRIAVTVTGTETGYSRSVKSSASHRIPS